VTFETDDNYLIRLDISNNSSTIRFNSIRNEKTLFAQHYSLGTLVSVVRGTLLSLCLKVSTLTSTKLTQTATLYWSHFFTKEI